MGLHLDESDACALARHVVRALRDLGAHVESIGVHLEREGFYFMARINGRHVWVQTGQGNFRYQDVAVELFHKALQPEPTTVRAEIIEEPA